MRPEQSCRLVRGGSRCQSPTSESPSSMARTDPIYQRFIRQAHRATPLPESLILEEAAFGPGGGRRELFEDPSRPCDSALGDGSHPSNRVLVSVPPIFQEAQ